MNKIVNTNKVFKCILASTNQNRNADVFLPEELWKSINTIKSKAVNINHENSELIGFCSDAYAVDKEYNRIEELTPPPYFHIMATIVLNGSSPKALAVIEKLEKTKGYVSMECLFSDFDYMLSNSTEQIVIPYDETTAFLNKYIRNEYDGYAVGRVLRNFSFDCLGVVDEPANTHSVIL